MESHLGKKCANHILALLYNKGISLRGPISGELSWFLYPIIDDMECEIMISWGTPLDHDDDLWVLRIYPKIKLWERLFRNKRVKYFEAVKKLVVIISDCMEKEKESQVVTNLIWLTEDEFADNYAT